MNLYLLVAGSYSKYFQTTAPPTHSLTHDIILMCVPPVLPPLATLQPFTDESESALHVRFIGCISAGDALEWRVSRLAVVQQHVPVASLVASLSAIMAFFRRQ